MALRRGRHQPKLELPEIIVPRVPVKRRRKIRAAGAAVTQTRYRKAPDTFAESPNGIVYDFNGIDPPRRWDGVTLVTEIAGIIGPKVTPQIAGTGAGPIVGNFWCYVRFKDRYGNVSSLSPLSNQFKAMQKVANVTGATNASPIVVTTDVAHNLSTKQIAKISGVYGNNAANDTWTVTVLSPTTFSLDGSTANGVYNSGGIVSTGVRTIVYSGVAIPTDAKITSRQILRNRDGSVDAFYVDVDTTDLTSDTFYSNTQSMDLAGAETVAITDLTGLDLAVNFNNPPPNDFGVATTQAGRMFAAVTVPYSEGCVSVATGSNAVTGIGVEWNMTTFVGRTFTVVGDNTVYGITQVTSLSTLVLDKPFAGTTDPIARYTIAPVWSRRRSFDWSAAGKPESYPLQNTRTLPEDHGSGDPTGLFSQGGWVYLTAEYWTYRFSWYKDPNTDGAFSLGSQRGCVNQRCVVSVGQIAFLMDYLGAHAFSGNDDQPISDAISDLFRNSPTSAYRINWRARKFFHGVFDPGDGFIRWFVALDGDYTPRHALVCDYRRKRWAIERFAFPIGASALGTLNGRPQVFVGTTAKRMFALNQGTLDGPNPQLGTVRGTATSAGPGWIQDTGASFPAAWVGLPLVTVEGTGRYQVRTIHSVSGGNTLYVRPAWSIRPDATTVYQVGGIPWVWRTGFVKWSDAPQAINRELNLLYNRIGTTAGFAMQLYDDTQDAALPAVETKALAAGDGIASVQDSPYLDVDATKSNGYVRVGMASYHARETDIPRYFSLELDGVTNLDRQSVWGVNVLGAEAP